MLEVDFPKDLASHMGERIGPSDWLTIDQTSINAFADLTGDDHWIHVDVERVAKERPGGVTIVHGLHLLSLIPKLQRSLYSIRHRGHGLNYGYDRVRFIDPVPVGTKIRMFLKILAVEEHWSGTRITLEATLEREGAERPVLVSNNILIISDEPAKAV